MDQHLTDDSSVSSLFSISQLVKSQPFILLYPEKGTHSGGEFPYSP